jgi:histidinol dehydrogenase
MTMSGSGLFAFVGCIGDVTPEQRARIFDRGRSTDPDVERTVRAVLADVRERGDTALLEMALRFDGANLDALEVPRSEWERALQELDADVRTALELAAHNIGVFHRAQIPDALEIEPRPGMKLGRRADPLRRVGVYAPGGRAAYPSSVLMGVVPARVAGVSEVVVCSPPGSNGLPPDTVLAACLIGGADRVFAIGGAGAVAAMAYGTASVPPVDRIVGPGNAYVTEAKRQVTGVVGIDSPAGPSEILIIADDSADATLLAAEIIAQAEHDPDAASVLVTTHPEHCTSVAEAALRMLADQPRRDIIEAALAARGALLVAPSLRAAAQFSEAYAPEHLLVMTVDARALLPELRAAGTIFLGAPSSVAFGDYITGANHVLPTAGLARSYAGLSTFDFLRWTTYQELSVDAAAALAGHTATLATAEGLPGHALAASLRSGGAPSRSEGNTATRPVVPRPAYAALSLYDPGRTPCEVDLSDNTNLYGPAPSVHDVLTEAGDERVTRYPTVYATALKNALAELHGVAPQNVVTGCGSDDVIDSAMRAFCDAGDVVAYPDPTFGMVPAFARMNAARAVAVPLIDGVTLDADALLSTQARVTYICRPNNPTGTLFDSEAVERVCREAAGVVLIDEAYADFAGNDFVDFAVRSQRTVVLRTFSKAFGLAGLRIGFALGPAHLVAEIEKSRGPYKVGGVAEAAALAVLSRDIGWVRARAHDVQRNRQRLAEELTSRGYPPMPGAANFLLIPVPGPAAEWNSRMRQRGVAIRPFGALPVMGECIRVTVGPWPLMERFLTAFDDVLTTMRDA